MLQDDGNRAERPSNADIAAEAGLIYVNDGDAGITRKSVGKHFSFLSPSGIPIKDKKIIDRIQYLAIPPAWTDVWICPNINGHIQATGRDARGRKQYRYHPEWQKTRDEAKFARY
jgi:DNA topoisomerase I